MNEKVSADEMQDCNGTIIEAKSSIKALAKVLRTTARNDHGQEYTEREVSPRDAVQVAATMLAMLADKLESAIVTTDNACSYGCVGTSEARAE